MTDAEQMEVSEWEDEKLTEDTVNSLTVAACVCQNCCRGGAVEVQVSTWMKMTAKLESFSYLLTY
jgi:hypothetical protein